MEINVDAINLLLSASLGAFIIYITAYLKEKGKNRSLKEDLSKLEHKKQEIITKYTKEIEEVKKEHLLDVEKKKHKYQSKKEQYFIFMENLDKFNGTSTGVLTEELSQIMMSYYASYHNVSNSSSDKLTREFNEKSLQAINKLKAQRVKLYSQLNALKLVANKKITSILEALIIRIQPI
jgi:hypothetical protein